MHCALHKGESVLEISNVQMSKKTNVSVSEVDEQEMDPATPEGNSFGDSVATDSATTPEAAVETDPRVAAGAKSEVTPGGSDPGATEETASGATAETDSVVPAGTDSEVTAGMDPEPTTRANQGVIAGANSEATQVAERGAEALAGTGLGTNAEVGTGASAETNSIFAAGTDQGATTETDSGTTAEVDSVDPAGTDPEATAETDPGVTAGTNSGTDTRTVTGPELIQTTVMELATAFEYERIRTVVTDRECGPAVDSDGCVPSSAGSNQVADADTLPQLSSEETELELPSATDEVSGHPLLASEVTYWLNTTLRGDAELRDTDAIADLADENDIPFEAESHEAPDSRDAGQSAQHETTVSGPTTGNKRRNRKPEERIRAYELKHPVRAAPALCLRGTCANRCSDHISETLRCHINSEVNHLDVEVRKQWFRTNVKLEKAQEDGKRRHLTWHLPTGDGGMKRVCKPFFLTTLGMKDNNDEAVRNAVLKAGSEVVPQSDRRGRHPPANKIDRQVIESHIKSFKPVSHHYRYNHAPNRLYLPSDINARIMYDDFNEKHPSFCSLDTYRRCVQDLNIGFTVLGSEECPTCKIFQQHIQESGQEHDQDGACETCRAQAEHETQARRARAEYRNDANRTWKDEELIVSADMMKVVVLPILPVKQCYFVPRLVAFNETFSVLMPAADDKSETQCRKDVQKRSSICVLWHEAIMGRGAAEVSNAYWKFLETNRDFKSITIYCDNCSGQNKCWLWLTTMVLAVNNENTALEKLTMKYLEAGHTSMSADSAHQVINKSLRKQKTTEDFSDFVEAVGTSGMRHCELDRNSLKDFQDGVSRQKLNLLAKEGKRPYLASVKVAETRRGDRRLFLKESFDQTQWNAYDILKTSFDEHEAPEKLEGGDSQREKIDTIRRELGPYMQAHKRQFWNALSAPARNGPDTPKRQLPRKTATAKRPRST